MKYILSLIISGALVVSGFGQTRNVLVGTNNAVVQPTNFWSADASNARTGLGLGTAATNPASAFQPSSATLSNLSLGNATGITNISASNIVGTLSIVQGGTGATNVSGARVSLGLGSAATNPATAFQASSLNLSNLASGDGGGLTNLQATNLIGVIPASNIAAVNFTNVSGTLSISSGGTGATNASTARQNLGSTAVGDAVFIATDAAAARTALVLGTAATSAVTDFQPASANLTNLSTNNGASLTGIPISGVVNLQSNLDTKLSTNGNAGGLSNITAANITGTVALASNITGTAPLASNVTGTVAIANGGTGATTASNARTALGASTVGENLFTLVNPSAIRFLRLNADNTATALSASDFRNAIGLNTAATNAESAFQPASTNLTTLAANNASALTNLQATNLVGLIPSSNIPSTTLTNISGTLAIASGGTGATNAANARLNLGSTTVGDAVFVATNAAAARTAIGALASNSDGSGLTNLTAANITGTVAIANGGTGAINAATARTNLGLGWSALTNTDATNFRNAIGLGTTNIVEFGQISSDDFGISNGAIYFGGQLKYEPENQTFQGDVFLDNGSLTISGTNAATKIAATRTNLGLPWSGLTNTNAATFQAALFGANTNPVLVDTNGEVVSPTNFWQAAPIATALQNSTPNATNTAANNARLLFLFSLVPTTTGVTNTVTLPTNGSTFNGDVATITHNAPTSSVTAIRQLGASTNLITLNQPDETARFLYRDNQWELMDNISYIEPIYFSGTNATANAAASRTNLGLGTTNNVTFSNISASGTLTATGVVTATTNLNVGGAIAVTNSAQTRTNLGLPLAALTNTNNANFRDAIELGATNDVTFNNVTASGTLTATGAVTFVTNLNVGGAIAVTNAAATRTNLGIGTSDEVTFGGINSESYIRVVSGTNIFVDLADDQNEFTAPTTFQTNVTVNGFVDFSTNHTNVAPATNNQVQRWLQIRIGTNAYFLPLYQ